MPDIRETRRSTPRPERAPTGSPEFSQMRQTMEANRRPPACDVDGQRQVLSAALGEKTLPAEGPALSALWRRYVATYDRLNQGRISPAARILGASSRPSDIRAIRVKRLGEGLRISLESLAGGGFISLRHGGVARQLAPDHHAAWAPTRRPLELLVSQDGEHMAARTAAGQYFLLRLRPSMWPTVGQDDPLWRRPPEGQPAAAEEVGALMREAEPNISLPYVRMLVGDDEGLSLEAPASGTGGTQPYYASVERSPNGLQSPLCFRPLAGADTWRRLAHVPASSALHWWQPPHPPVRCSAPAGPTLPPREGGAVDFTPTFLLTSAAAASQDWQLADGDDAVLVRQGRSPEQLVVWAQGHRPDNLRLPTLDLARPPRRVMLSRDQNQLAVIDVAGEVSSWQLSRWPAPRRTWVRDAQAPLPERLAISPDGLSLALALAPQHGLPPHVELWALGDDGPVQMGPAAPTPAWSLASLFFRPPRLREFTFTDCGTRLLAVTDAPAAWLWDLAEG